jgi:precorrin-2 dehydrogenase/sirohydrochlorin ferrochelatase
MKQAHDQAYFPLFVKLADQACLVVGGGKVAERKVHELAATGARVTVVSPDITDGLAALAAAGAIFYVKKAFAPEDVDGSVLVVAATDNETVNRQVALEAQRLGVWCNVVSEPELCTVMVPSVFRRGKLTLAISTGGASPALARHIRQELDEVFGPEYGLALEILAELRKVGKRLIGDGAQRQDVLRRILTADLLKLCRERKEEQLVHLVETAAGPKVGEEMVRGIRSIFGGKGI